MDSSLQLTSAATILSSAHGRMRRAQRLIDKRDLQAAVKHGKCEVTYSTRPPYRKRLKYTFADVVYITDETSRHEITSWAVPGAGLDVQKHPISKVMKLKHKQACERIAVDKSSWTSHTVIVVDQSGSMRKTDVEGGATRSDAVWLTTALDYVARQLEMKESSDTDVVSIIALGVTGTVLVNHKPHDWLLYNSVVDLLRSQLPQYPGNYVPALQLAESLLVSNTCGSCILNLFFLSDGRPSDEGVNTIGPFGGYTLDGHMQMMQGHIDSLACRFGRRLSIITVGFGGPNEDFSVLKHMAKRPTQFNSNGRFFSAQLNLKALDSAFTCISTSLKKTRSELTALGESTQREVRSVRRCPKNDVGQNFCPHRKGWYSYEGGVYWQLERWVYSSVDRVFKALPPMSPAACGVALAPMYFGEGAERLVREFRELGPGGKFIGPKLVAKESRFQRDVANTSRQQRIRYHRTFCDVQDRAQRLAEAFNARLEKVPGYIPGTTPKIRFLEYCVYVVTDRNLGEIGLLVEKLLDTKKYQKWNDNCGAVDGQIPYESGAGRRGSTSLHEMPLDEIAQCDEEHANDSEDACMEEEFVDEMFTISDIPQAFSHFTYRYTQRRLLVCDLQGVLSTTSPPWFEFTDPVIHFMSHRKKKHVFGRTDRGWKGKNDFFSTHQCGPLCRMMNRRWYQKG
ncbi:unnamed protein product, partial [Heterosigma akashiwo]